MGPWGPKALGLTTTWSAEFQPVHANRVCRKKKGEGIFMVNGRVIVTAEGTRKTSFLMASNSDFKQKYVIYI